MTYPTAGIHTLTVDFYKYPAIILIYLCYTLVHTTKDTFRSYRYRFQFVQSICRIKSYSKNVTRPAHRYTPLIVPSSLAAITDNDKQVAQASLRLKS